MTTQDIVLLHDLTVRLDGVAATLEGLGSRYPSLREFLDTHAQETRLSAVSLKCLRDEQIESTSPLRPSAQSVDENPATADQAVS